MPDSLYNGNAKSRAEWSKLNTLYHVSPAEWEASEAQWRAWVAQRDTAGALDAGRFHVPSSKPKWQERGEGEERFSKVLKPLHEKCVMCSAIEEVEADVTLTEDEKRARLVVLAHEVPTLRFLWTGSLEAAQRTRGDGFDDTVSKKSEQGRPIQTGTSSRGEYWRRALPKLDVLGQESHEKRDQYDWRDGRSATNVLLTNANETALLGAVIADPSLSQRAKVFRENKTTVEKAISEADTLQCLSTAEKYTYSTVAAEAWELERDLVRLEKMQESIKLRLHSARIGYSVNHYNEKRCSDRRRNWMDTGTHPIMYGSLGLHKMACTESDAGEEEREYGEKVVTMGERWGQIKSSIQQHQQLPPYAGQGERINLKGELASSPTPPEATRVPIQSEDEQGPGPISPGPSSESGQGPRGSASTKGNSVNWAAVREALSSTSSPTPSGHGEENETRS